MTTRDVQMPMINSLISDGRVLQNRLNAGIEIGQVTETGLECNRRNAPVRPLPSG